MKAIVQDVYGRPGDVLKLSDVDQPRVGGGEVLVRVSAASIHVGDVYGIRGVPYVFRTIYGLRRPKATTPGTDIAGTVEAVAPGVTELSVGDGVFGWCSGAFAEFAVTAADALVRKPDGVSFDHSAAVGVSAQTALQALRDAGEVAAGHSVLVNGASGGVGTFAVQIAKSRGAAVTAVCSTRNVELMTSIGADHVIDYTREDFTRGDARYDFILDNVGNHSFAATRRVLSPGGKLLSNGARVGTWLSPIGHFVKAGLSSMVIGGQARPIGQVSSTEDLATLMDLVVAGAVKPVIDETFPLAEAAAAVAHVDAGHTRGTTVITMS